MATYAELATIKDDDAWNGLVNKIAVACAIKATAVIDSATPGVAVLEWAKQSVAEPLKASNDIVYYVVSSNSSATLAQIYSASDVAIQNNVDAAIDSVYGA